MTLTRLDGGLSEVEKIKIVLRTKGAAYGHA